LETGCVLGIGRGGLLASLSPFRVDVTPLDGLNYEISLRAQGRRGSEHVKQEILFRLFNPTIGVVTRGRAVGMIQKNIAIA
jgi:hypothetical protein